MPRTRSETTQYVCDSLRRYGLRLNGSSRFAQMAALLTPGHLISFNDPDFAAARRAMHDSMILGFVLDQLGEPMAGTKYREMLQMCISDPLLPKDNPDRTPGRDVQTELFMAAMLQKAGLQPLFEEPDITCQLKNTKIAVAVKRPKNPFSVRDNLLAARAQIDRRGMPGVIVLDMSVATDDTYEGFDIPLTRARMAQLIYRFFQERIVGRLLSNLAGDIQTGRSMGVVFLLQCVYLEVEARDFALFNHTGSFGRQNDHTLKRLFLRFFDDLGKGLPE